MVVYTESLEESWPILVIAQVPYPYSRTARFELPQREEIHRPPDRARQGLVTDEPLG